MKPPSPAPRHMAVLQSQLGRVRGLGSAKSGVAHWWAQRMTALALIPLSLWFIWHVIALAGLPHDAVLAWFASPWTTALMLCLVVATFHHMQLGVQVVIEDYVHNEPARFAALIALRGVSFLLALACAVSALRLGL